MPRCDWCTLDQPDGFVFGGLCKPCLGPSSKWAKTAQTLREEIGKIEAQIKASRHPEDGLRSCLKDYRQHLAAYDLAIAAALEGGKRPKSILGSPARGRVAG